MKEISYREFQRGFCKLKEERVSLRVIGKGGVILGEWIPGVDIKSEAIEKDIVPSESNKTLDLEQLQESAESYSLNESGVLAFTPPQCIKHPNLQALWRGKIWEDGEEVEVVVCGYCYKTIQNKKSFKQI